MNMMTAREARRRRNIAKAQADRVRTVSRRSGIDDGVLRCTTTSSIRQGKDFYSMEAFFADVRQWGFTRIIPTRQQDLKGYNNDYPFRRN